MKRRGAFYIRQSFPAIALTIIVFMLPVGAVFLRAFSSETALADTFTDPYTYRLLGFTIWESVLSAAISVAFAIPFALFFSRYTFPGRRAILTMSDAAFALPAILAVLGFVIYYGNNGVLNSLLPYKVKILYSFKAIILAHVFLNFPVAFSLITSSLMSTADMEEKTSRLLGASEFKTFLFVTLPKVRGTIMATFTLIFLFCFPSFLIVMSLGGNPRFFTMEAEIYKRTYTDVNPASSAALAIFSFMVMSILLIATGYGREERKVSRSRRTLVEARGIKLMEAISLCLLILLFIAPPLLSILYRSFFTKDNGFTMKAWLGIFTKSRTGMSTSLNAVINSIFLALSSALLSIWMASSIGMCTVRTGSRMLGVLTSLPMAVGSVSMGLGFAFIAARMPFRFIAISYLLVLLAHMVCVLPFAVRTIIPGARRIPECLSLTANTLGRDTKSAYRDIEYPLLKPYRRRAFAFSFALSLGEVNATLALGEGKVTTIPVLIYKMINQYNYQGASALAVILIGIALVVFSIGERKGEDYGIS